jgi:protoheme IX farnesyltransferase
VNKLRAYLSLTKPGIVRGNVIAAIAGFFVGTAWPASWSGLTALIAGLGLVISAACVFNNILDRDIDGRMTRTRKRPLVMGAISVRSATVFGAALLATGAIILGAFTNLLTLGFALLGLILYVPIYTYAKRQTPYGTEIGSLSGAVPPVVGYTAATGRVDLTAAILFLILVIWQMPHFFAIAIYRLDEYRAAGLPVLPVVHGVAAARRRILWYVAVFVPVVLALPLAGHASTTYMVVSGALALTWLAFGLFRWQQPDVAWARSMFRLSLVVLLGVCTMLALNHVLP